MQSFPPHERAAHMPRQVAAQDSARLKVAGEGERVELAAVGRVVIFAPAAYRRETRGPIHGHGRISIAHFEMNSFDTVRRARVR